MDKLLHYYEQELVRLRDSTAALEPNANAEMDPEVERLLQSVALMNAAPKQLIEAGKSDSLEALQSIIQLHGCNQVPAFKSLIAQPAEEWVDRGKGPVLMFGTDFSITVDEDSLHGFNLTTLAIIVEHILAARACEGRFIRLSLLRVSGQALYRGTPQPGRRHAI